MTHAAGDVPSTVLVTGGSGRLGRHVVAALSSRYVVINGDLEVDGPDDVRLDILDYEAVTRAMRGADAVVHLAALDYDAHAAPRDVMRVNVLGSWNILQAAASSADVRRLVLCSSVAALGLYEMRSDWTPQSLPVTETHEARPAEAYGLSKLMLEEMAAAVVRSHGFDVMCVRPAAIVFPEHLDDFLRTVDGSAPSLHDYVSAEDVARAMLLALEGSWSGYQCIQLCADDSAQAIPGPAPYSNERAAQVLGWRPTSDFATLSFSAGGSHDQKELE